MKPRNSWVWLIVLSLGLLPMMPMRAHAGVTPEELKRFDYWKTLAEKGDASAQYQTGECYAMGVGVAKDYAEAAKWNRKSADQGYSGGQMALGFAYYYGHGVAKSAEDAAQCFRKASGQDVTTSNPGVTTAKFWLGYCYELGSGVRRDYIEAYACYSLAAKTAPSGTGAVGIYWNNKLFTLEKRLSSEDLLRGKRRTKQLQGEIETKRLEKALNLGILTEAPPQVRPTITQEQLKALELAALRGDAVSQCNLGLCYAYGQGVAVDFTVAVKWLRKAADQGVAVAQSHLGLCYAEGHGFAKNSVEAVSWFRKSADQENAGGQYYLGNSYFKGEGVARSEVEAYAYWSLAGVNIELARRSPADSPSTSSAILKDLPLEVISRAKQRAKILQQGIDTKMVDAEKKPVR